MSRDPWNPQQYERFKDERTQPFHDLLALVKPSPGGRAVDLGCGTGELTRLLHQHAQTALTLGLDSSEAMLAKSAAFASESLWFRRGDIATFEEGGWDIVFSNAALQWVSDHPALFRRIANLVAPGGQLAVQMPANDDHPSHVVANAVALEEPFREALGGYQRPRRVLEAVEYAALLDQLGFESQNVRLQIYAHHLASREDVVEWVKGTMLTDFEKRMPASLFQEFLGRYRNRLIQALPDQRPFFYPFKRLLLWGRKERGSG